jgi:hypothetical protein
MIKYLDGRPVVETAVARRGGILANEAWLIGFATSVLVFAVAVAVYWRMA